LDRPCAGVLAEKDGLAVELPGLGEKKRGGQPIVSFVEVLYAFSQVRDGDQVDAAGMTQDVLKDVRPVVTAAGRTGATAIRTACGMARALPGKGVLEAVRFKGYWASSWGARPDDVTDAEAAAAHHLAAAPWLVPIFGRRYLPAGRGTYGHPVLSVYGADIICWAPNLVDYVLQEFGEGGVGKRYSYEAREMSASAELWAEYLAWPALEP
jgi:hypothetical protein